MDKHIKKVYVPMTETAFFILFCLRKPNPLFDIFFVYLLHGQNELRCLFPFLISFHTLSLERA